LIEIILIRLRQRPSSNNDPIQTFNDSIKQLKENTKVNEQSNEFKTVVQLAKKIPIIKSSNRISTDESVKDANRLTGVYVYQNKLDSLNDRLQQLVSHICSKWHHLIRKQPKIPIWILLGIFILSSVMLWYMIVLLCRHTPRHHNISIQPQELIIDNIYEKEKLQPNEIKLGNN